jgi:hypothetical protein
VYTHGVDPEGDWPADLASVPLHGLLRRCEQYEQRRAGQARE